VAAQAWLAHSMCGDTAETGVLGAIHLQHQRSVTQDDFLTCERGKHDGSLPIVGVNTFLPRDRAEANPASSAPAPGQTPSIQLRRARKWHPAHSYDPWTAILGPP
jgi:isobutyryl-CoA mutase